MVAGYCIRQLLHPTGDDEEFAVAGGELVGEALALLAVFVRSIGEKHG